MHKTRNGNQIFLKETTEACRRDSQRLDVEFWICGRPEGHDDICVHFRVLDISRTGAGLRLEGFHVSGNEEPHVLERLVQKGAIVEFSGSKTSFFYDVCSSCQCGKELEFYDFLNVKGMIMWTCADRCGIQFLEPLTDTDHELIEELET